MVKNRIKYARKNCSAVISNPAYAIRNPKNHRIVKLKVLPIRRNIMLLNCDSTIGEKTPPKVPRTCLDSAVFTTCDITIKRTFAKL